MPNSRRNTCVTTTFARLCTGHPRYTMHPSPHGSAWRKAITLAREFVCNQITYCRSLLCLHRAAALMRQGVAEGEEVGSYLTAQDHDFAHKVDTVPDYCSTASMGVDTGVRDRGRSQPTTEIERRNQGYTVVMRGLNTTQVTGKDLPFLAPLSQAAPPSTNFSGCQYNLKNAQHCAFYRAFCNLEESAT